jgi:DNA-binding transcriptional LysR family regulator
MAVGAHDIAICEVVAFVTVVERRGFCAAAETLYLSQPAVSGRVARLERAVGAKLIDRSFREVTLTPAGRAFLPFARSLLLQLTAAVADSRAAATDDGGNRNPLRSIA